MKESELYQPLKDFLEEQGYRVKGEVKNCDVLAIRGNEEPVVVELKLAINLNLILQAVDRQTMTSKVYIGVPLSCKLLYKQRRQLTKLLRMLGLGLIVINANAAASSVEVFLDPEEYKPRKSKARREKLLSEFARRVGDPNPGGVSTKKGVMTAYRQRALLIGSHLIRNGASKASTISTTLEEPKARNILYRNVYGWFERESQGVYKVSAKGEEEISQWVYIKGSKK